MENLIQEVLAVAAQHPQGFTYHLSLKKLVKMGIVVAFNETQSSFGNDGLKKCIVHALENKSNIIGGWKNEDGVVQYDSVRVFFSRQQALAFARQHEQRYIFDLTHLEEIKVD